MTLTIPKTNCWHRGWWYHVSHSSSLCIDLANDKHFNALYNICFQNILYFTKPIILHSRKKLRKGGIHIVNKNYNNNDLIEMIFYQHRYSFKMAPTLPILTFSDLMVLSLQVLHHNKIVSVISLICDDQYDESSLLLLMVKIFVAIIQSMNGRRTQITGSVLASLNLIKYNHPPFRISVLSAVFRNVTTEICPT